MEVTNPCQHKVIAAMEDYNRVLEATEVAENANGVAAEKMTVYNESLEAAQNRLTASIQQFAQDSNLDRILALAYDGLSKVVDILNILLNKFPVLSPMIKALGVALAAAFAAGTIAKIVETSTMLSSIVSIVPSVISAFTTASGVIEGFGAALYAAAGPLGVILGLLGAVIGLAPAVSAAWNAMFPTAEQKAKEAQEALEQSQQDLDETKDKIKELTDKIDEIDSKGTLTLADEAEKDRLQEQLDILEKIKETQGQINQEKQAGALEAEQTKVKGMTSYSEDEISQYQTGLATTSNYATAISTDNINELIAAYRQLNEEKKNLDSSDEDYAQQIETNEQLTSSFTSKLLEQKQAYLDEMNTLAELGDTSSDYYNKLQESVNAINVTLDPSQFPKIDLGEMIETSGMENKIKMVVQSGSEAGKKVAEGYANELAQGIHDNEVSLEAWKEALNIPDSQELGINQLTQEILAMFQEMYGGISEASESAAQGFTDQHTALDAYQEAVQNIHDSTTDLTAAYQDMIDKGYISESVVKKLTAAHPELVKELVLENGQYKINLQTLKDVYTAEVNKSIASIEAEKKQTQATSESIQQRIDMYQKEVDALTDQAIAMGDESAKARLIGAQHSLDRAKWELADLQKNAEGVDKYIEDLKKNAADWSPTSKKSSSSTKSAADKAAKEFESAIKEKVKNLKSIVQLYAENTNWDDPEVIKDFQSRYDKILDEVMDDPKARKVLADVFNLDIKDMPVEQQIQELTALWQKQAGTIQEEYQKLLKAQTKTDLQSIKNVVNAYKEGVYGAWSSDEAVEEATKAYDEFLNKLQDENYRKAMAETLNLGDISTKPVEEQIQAITNAVHESAGTIEETQQDLYDDASKNIKALQDEIEDMLDTAIDLLEKAGDFLFDMLGKISDRYDAQIDNLDKISDELDDQKDAFEDKIDQQKELLKLQKEEMDNADELAEKNKSIADIDAQLMELQYDNSAEAQAKRLKLLDERAEKEKDLADWQKDNDYDVKIDALDKEKSEYEKTIEAEKKAIEAQKQTLQDAQKQFETTLSKIQNGFNTFIKILSSDFVKNIISKALIGTGQDTVTNLLTSYNKLFGTGIDSDVTDTIKKGYKSLGDIGSDILNSVSSSSNEIVKNAAKGISSIVNNTTNGIKSIFDSSNGLMQRLTSNGVFSLKTMGTSGQGILSSLANTAGGLLQNLGGIAGNIVQIAFGGITKIFSGIGGIVSKIGGGIGSLLGIGGGAAATGAATAGTGAAVAGGAGLAGIAGSLALPLAVAGGVAAGASTWVNNIRLWKDKDKTTGQKIWGTLGNLALMLSPVGGIISIVKAFKKHHAGADYVKKQNPALDRMLGLGNDETVSILKVGEAVVPTWANNATRSSSSNSYSGSPFGSAVDSAVKSARAISNSSYTTNNAPVNISMPINIQGNADSSTVKALKDVRNDIVSQVMKTINNQTRIGGYRNIKAATV